MWPAAASPFFMNERRFADPFKALNNFFMLSSFGF
jgi:hypothetical protein